MAEPPAHSESPGAGERSEPGSTGAPRWVKVLGVVAIILVVLFVILVLTGIGGSHGPSRHTASDSAQSLVSPGVRSLDPLGGSRG